MFEEPLTDSNYMMYAMKHYTNPECSSVEEFQEDINRIKYLKRLFGKYQNQGLLKERLILNHIIIMYNVFPIVPATRLLFHRIEEKYHTELKTFLVFLVIVKNARQEMKLKQEAQHRASSGAFSSLGKLAEEASQSTKYQHMGAKAMMVALPSRG